MSEILSVELKVKGTKIKLSIGECVELRDKLNTLTGRGFDLSKGIGYPIMDGPSSPQPNYPWAPNPTVTYCTSN